MGHGGRPPGEATRLLERVGRGDREAAAELLALVGGELHALARELMREERGDHTLQPTALVNEAWIRMVGGGFPTRVEDRRHFLRLAARAMRHALVDHARARARLKRGGGRTCLRLEPEAGPAADALDAWQERRVDLLDLEEALARLEARDEELARVVELRWFAGLTCTEAGDVLGVGERAVRASWDLARAFLRRELGRGGAPEDA